jgi:hypothetical protein
MSGLRRTSRPGRESASLSLAVRRPYRILPINPFCETRRCIYFAEADKGVIPLKTEQSTLWAVKNFDCWVHARSSSSSNVVPPDLLRSHAELVLLCPGNEKDGWITLPASDCAVASERLKLHLAFQETLITDISLP